MGRLLTLLLLLISSSAQAVCLEEIYGEFYGCKSLAQDKGAVKWCKKKYGEGFLPYYTTNTCSKQMAFEARGEEYKPTKKQKEQDDYGVVKAACMTYEKSQKYSCEYYDYEPAQRYCSYYYGNKYLAFFPEGKCSMANASAARGEVSSKKLLEGLSSLMDEAEAVMTSIDRHGVESSMGGLASGKPKIGAEFYTEPMKRIMATMNMLKKQIYKNSHLKVRMDGDHVKTFLQYNFRYLALLARLYKTYAYVAHLNHYVLKSYDFKNLEYLNLRMKKEIGLEILNRVNYKVITANDGKDIEFVVGEQDRQTYEYLAMEKPESKTDYAKLITFIGARENLTNLWAVQRLTTKNIQAYKIDSCGKGFLSMRAPGDNMKNSAAMNDLWDYDVFYNGYAPKWNDLVDASWEVDILDTNTKGKKLAYWTYKQVAELKTYLQTDIQTPIQDDNGFWEFAAQDGVMLNAAESETWKAFSNDHFSTFVLPGDNVRNKSKVVKRIVQEAYNKRVKAIVDTFQGAYPFLTDKGLAAVEEYINRYTSKYLKEDFETRLTMKLSSALAGYNNSSQLRPKNRKDKVDEILEVLKHTIRGAYIVDKIEDEKNIFNGMKLLDPRSMQELMTLFQHKLGRFYDLRLTLERKPEFAQLLQNFFTEVTNKFNDRFISIDEYGNYEYNAEADARREGLREIVYEVAREYYKKYPYSIQDLMVRPNETLVYQYTVAQDNTYVKPYMEYIPVYEDGTPAVLSNHDVQFSFDPKKFNLDFNRDDSDRYIVQQDNTYVHINPMFTGVIPIKEKEKTVTSGYNKDKITTGEIGKPIRVTDSGNIVTPNGVDYVPQEDIIDILDRVKAYNKDAVAKYKIKSSPQQKRKNHFERFDTHEHIIQSEAQFFYRVFAALNVHVISLSKTFLGGQFANTEDDQLFLGQNLKGEALQAAPMLRKVLIEGDDYEHTLLDLLVARVYNPTKGKITLEKSARDLIEQTIDKAVNSTSTQLAKFCNANYLNYKNDSRFKEIFHGAKFLRATLKSPYASRESEAEKIANFDEGIRKDLRTKWQAFNEDWGEPALKVLGTAALIALAIVLIVGSGGTATPGVMAGAFSVKAALAGAASTFLAVEFFISFPLVVSSAYNRINTHFYELPAQIRFQKSLAHSQIDYSEVVDWDMIRADEKANTKQKWMQIPLIALDALYAGMLFRHVAKTTGFIGRGAYRRQTGVKLRGISAPPKSMFIKSGRFKDLRRQQGFFKAVKTKVNTVVTNAKMYLPKYQPLPPQMLNGVPLRMGIMKQAKKLGVASEPWKLLDDIRAYQQKLASRYTEFKHFVAAEGEILGKVRLNGKFTLKEVMQHGMQYHKLAFIPKSYWQAVKSLDGKTFLKYLTDNDALWTKLKHMQGELVKKRADDIAKTISKMEDFQKAAKNGHITSQGDEMMGDLLRRLTDDEIMVLQEISRRSKGIMSNFKSVFKDHRKIVEGLRPISYLYGKAGVPFNPNSIYQNVIMGDIVSHNYKFQKPVEDLVNYYESMAKNYGNLSEEMRIMRREIEGDISHHMNVDNAGNRTFND